MKRLTPLGQFVVGVIVGLILGLTVTWALAQEVTSPIPPANPPSTVESLTKAIGQQDLMLSGISLTRAYLQKLWGDLDRDQAVSEKERNKLQAQLDELKKPKDGKKK